MGAFCDSQICLRGVHLLCRRFGAVKHRGISSYAMEMAELVNTDTFIRHFFTHFATYLMTPLCQALQPTAAEEFVYLQIMCVRCHSTDSIVSEYYLDHKWRELRVLRSIWHWRWLQDLSQCFPSRARDTATTYANNWRPPPANRQPIAGGVSPSRCFVRVLLHARGVSKRG